VLHTAGASASVAFHLRCALQRISTSGGGGGGGGGSHAVIADESDLIQVTIGLTLTPDLVTG